MPAYGVLQGNVAMQLGDFYLESSADNLTAYAGGGQANALQLVSQTSRIITVATAGDSVRLPVSAAGMEVLVINHGANSMQVYGAGTDTIDDQATATGVSHMSNSLVIYTCATGGSWYSEGLATGYVKGQGFQTLSYATIAANSGGVQSGATPLTAMINGVTAAASGYSVLLPVSAPGMSIQVICETGSDTIKVFPNAGGTTTETINALAANGAITMAALTSATFICVVAGQWWTSPRVPS